MKVLRSLALASIVVGFAVGTSWAQGLAPCSQDRNTCMGKHLSKPENCRAMFAQCMTTGHWVGIVSKVDYGPRLKE